MRRNLVWASAACMALASACVMVKVSGSESLALEPQGLDQTDLKASSKSPADIEIHDFVGRLEIRTSANSGMSVSMSPGQIVTDGKLDAPRITESAGRIEIVGDASARMQQCDSEDEEYRIKGDKRRPLREFPSVVITAPDSASLSISMRGGLAEIGEVEKAYLALNGCADVEIGDVARELAVDISGSGDVNAKDAGALKASINGSGDIEAQDIRSGVKLGIRGAGDIEIGDVGGDFVGSITGSGDIEVDDVDGSVFAEIEGAGDIDIGGGVHPETEIRVRGAGDVDVGGLSKSLKVGISGAGDVSVEALEGPLTGRASGAGDLYIGGKSVPKKNGVFIR